MILCAPRPRERDKFPCVRERICAIIFTCLIETFVIIKMGSRKEVIIMSLDNFSGLQSISAIRAVQPYTSVLYGVAPSSAAVRAGTKAAQQDAQQTQAKLAAQQAATDTGQDTSASDTSLTTVTRDIGDGTLLVEELRGSQIISSQRIQVAQAGADDRGDTIARAYAQAGGLWKYEGLLYDVQA